MSDLPPLKRNIQIEEARFRFSVSESLFQKVGQSLNFVNDRQHSEKEFFLNGLYAGAVGTTAIDGAMFFQFDAQIIDVFMWSRTQGSGGTTELDIKVKSSPTGGSWNSIFTTTPKFTSGAGVQTWNSTTIANPGSTQPILNTTFTDTITAGTAMRMDLVQAMSGTPRNAAIVVHYKPR